MKFPLLIPAIYLTLILECFAQSAVFPAAVFPIEVRRDVYLMGTRASLQTYAPDRQTGLNRIESYLRTLEDSEAELSTWRPDSAISRLNRQPVGERFPLKASLCRLFDELRAWTYRTDGAFDPAIGTLVEAWGLHRGGHRPTAEELQLGLENAGFDYLDLDAENCVVVRNRPILIEVGAFGKGDALDRVLDYSRAAGIDAWMIDLGGQIMVHGTPPNRDSWSLALAHPLDRTQAVLGIALRDGSLATSGGSERDIGTGEARIGHILDPKTGQALERKFAVTVWHPRALIADILSTALYVMGMDQGLAWAERHDIAAAFLIPEDGGRVQVRRTHLFEKIFLND